MASYYYTGSTGASILQRRALQKREEGFDTRSPKWEHGLSQYDARTDPYCPVTRTSRFRKRLQHVSKLDEPSIERLRASQGAPPLPNVRAEPSIVDRPLQSMPSTQLQVVRCIEVYDFQLVTLRHFVDSLPDELSRSPMLGTARHVLADLLAGLRYAVLNAVEMVQRWRRRSAAPAEPFLWAGANFFVTIQLDMLETFGPALAVAQDPLLLRCFGGAPEPAAPGGADGAHGAGPRGAGWRARSPAKHMRGRSPAGRRPARGVSHPASILEPAKVHSPTDLERMRVAERALVREAAAVGANLRDQPGDAVHAPSKAELKLRCLCHGAASLARWHHRLASTAANVIQSHHRGQLAAIAEVGAAQSEAAAKIHYAMRPMRARARARIDSAVTIQAHERRAQASRRVQALRAAQGYVDVGVQTAWPPKKRALTPSQFAQPDPFGYRNGRPGLPAATPPPPKDGRVRRYFNLPRASQLRTPEVTDPEIVARVKALHTPVPPAGHAGRRVLGAARREPAPSSSGRGSPPHVRMAEAQRARNAALLKSAPPPPALGAKPATGPARARTHAAGERDPRPFTPLTGWGSTEPAKTPDLPLTNASRADGGAVAARPPSEPAPPAPAPAATPASAPAGVTDAAAIEPPAAPSAAPSAPAPSAPGTGPAEPAAPAAQQELASASYQSSGSEMPPADDADHPAPAHGSGVAAAGPPAAAARGDAVDVDGGVVAAAPAATVGNHSAVVAPAAASSSAADEAAPAGDQQ